MSTIPPQFINTITPPHRQPYSAVFIVATKLTGSGRVVSTIERLSHWKLWIHSLDHHDYFFQIYKDTQNGRPIADPLPERGWKEREKQNMRDNCRFIGLTTQSFADVEEKGENPTSAFSVASTSLNLIIS
jgi:hypothetical protein